MDEEAELQRLIEVHKTCTTDRLKTACENKLWEVAKTSKGLTAKRSYWLETTLGYKESYKHRETLAEAPPAFWDYTESNSMKLPEAVKLWYEVIGIKKICRRSINYCLDEAIGIREGKTRKSKTEIAPKEPPKISVIQEGWDELRQALEKCLTPVLATMSPQQKIKHIPRFNRGIQATIAALYAALKRDAEAPNTVPVSVAELREACTLLGVKIPEFKTLVDLAEAKRNKRTLVYRVHPDQSITPNLELFQSYLIAYDILEKYNNQITAHEKEEESYGTNTDGL